MKVITLTQPYATLIAVGEKRIETRSWATRHRGRIAIHAGIGLEPVGGMAGLVRLIESEPFASVLRPHLSGYTPEERAADLPRGAIVAVATLTACIPTLMMDERYPPSHAAPHEFAFGDYHAGRYAWVLKSVENLHDGIACKGALGLWNPPKEARAELAVYEAA